MNALLAWYFVAVWGSGYVATKIGLQYAPPFTFLTLRFGFGLLCLAPVVLLWKPRWPENRTELGQNHGVRRFSRHGLLAALRLEQINAIMGHLISSWGRVKAPAAEISYPADDCRFRKTTEDYSPLSSLNYKRTLRGLQIDGLRALRVRLDIE